MTYQNETSHQASAKPTFNQAFKGRHGGDQFTKLLFESDYKISVPVDVNVSVEVVVTRKSNTIRNFPCTVRQCPVVLTTLKASLVCTAVSTLNGPINQQFQLPSRVKACRLCRRRSTRQVQVQLKFPTPALPLGPE